MKNKKEIEELTQININNVDEIETTIDIIEDYIEKINEAVAEEDHEENLDYIEEVLNETTYKLNYLIGSLKGKLINIEQASTTLQGILLLK